MANEPGRTRQPAPPTTPVGLLATKLHLPHPPQGHVPRRRLDSRLDGGLRGELILVSAPAGFGKTTMLAEWCRYGRHPHAWLSLDPGDNDPVRFWRHVVAALEPVRPGLAEYVTPTLGPPAPASLKAPVSDIVNHLAGADGEVLLVVDDYHLIEAQPVHESLEFLLQHQPPGLHVVLSSRTDPPLPLAKWRAGGQLTELRATDLMFSAPEAAVLLESAGEAQLNDDAVAALVARTEGWAAGLQLAALSLREQPDQPAVATFVQNFSGSHRHVLDFLTEEVLEQQPVSLREFMLETSVLDRLSGPLCDAVTGRSDGQQMLEAVEAANLFLTPLDDVRSWWRYHQLFSDLLRVRLQQLDPERMRDLHRNAGAWHEEHGPVDDAVRHALAAEDHEWAAELIERHFDALYLGSQGATVQRWLAGLPAGLADARPRLLLARARLAYLAGEVDAADGLLNSAERTSTERPDDRSRGMSTGSTELSATIAVERAIVANLRGRPEDAARNAKDALDKLGDGRSMLESLARWHLGLAEWLHGRLPAAERSLAASARNWVAAGEFTLATWACQYREQLSRARGLLNAAAETCADALELAAPADRPAHPAAGVAYVGLAEVAYQRGDLDAARQHLTDGLPLCRRFVYTQPLAIGLATQAWLRQAEGDATGALTAMDEAGRIADPGVADVLTPVLADRARLLLAQGDVAGAQRWTTEKGLDPDDEPDYPHEPAYLVLARVLLARSLPDKALALLDRLHALATTQDRGGSVIEIQALRSLALVAGGDEDGAAGALADALVRGAAQGYVRVFVDEGTPMAAALGRYIAAHPRTDPAVPADYLGRIVGAFDRRIEGAPEAPGLVTQLSARELEVLTMMAAGKANRQIADELFVSLHTVKKHVTHILDKLGAANRTEAATRARELGLLP